jgi:hypothetical protein
MSAKLVVPPSIISSAASRVPSYTNPGETFFPSAGKMFSVSHRSSGRSSAIPRRSVIAAWVWVLTSPGSTSLPVAS